MARSRNKYKKKNLQTQSEKPVASDVVVESVDANENITRTEVDTNALVLPAHKEKGKKRKKEIIQPKKKLTKKQRRQLQQVVDRKAKKLKRADILEELAKVQVKPSELAMMSSVAHLGTKNSSLVQNLSKRPLPADLKVEVEKLNSIRLSKKQRRMKNEQMHSTAEEEEISEDVTSSDDESIQDDQIDELPNANDSGHDTESSRIEDKPEVLPPVSDVKKSNDLQTDNKSPNKEPLQTKINTTYVAVNRDPEIQENRLKLPIIGVEQEIVEAVHHNPVVVLCGETGSGKTTQVPQFLYEAGYAENGLIGVTEPRRVAAISMSQRVASEMNLTSEIVSYQIRYEGNTTENTKVKFMTDGVLLREVQRDFMLTKYSVIIIDEAHERSVYTDVLIGLLSRIVPLRHKRGNPLKLIVMSATLRVQDFVENQKLFKEKPPLIKVEARQFPVTIHFNRRTPSDIANGRAYIREAYNKICKIHRTLPSGGILVFVTGQHEVHSLCRMLKSTFPMVPVSNKQSKSVKDAKKNSSNYVEKGAEKATTSEDIEKNNVNLDEYTVAPDADNINELDEDRTDDKDAPANLSDDEGIVSDAEIFEDDGFSAEFDNSLPMCVLPLYSLLAPSQQRKIFMEPSSEARMCIISTNVAETSLTIPGVKYVVDTGKVKKRVYDKVTGVSSFQVSWISQASADQRAGRAGRTSAGHTYRLYSSAVFQDFDKFSIPEIASRPVADLVLQMKHLNIDRVVNFPFPTPPSAESLVASEKLLVSLGAIEQPKKTFLKSNQFTENCGKITDLGRAIAAFPVHPRFGKMLATATADEYVELLPYVITIVAALTVRDVFDEANHVPNNEEQKQEQKSMHARLKHFKSLWGGGSNQSLQDMGDIMVLLGAVGSADYSGLTPGFCSRNCLRFKAMTEIRRLRSQLINTINLVKPDSNIFLDSKLHPPTNKQVELLRQIILSAFGDHVARKIPDNHVQISGDAAQIKKLSGGFYSLLMEEPVFIHPTSILSQRTKLPEYVVFQEIIESMSGRPYMKEVVVIESEWLPIVCPQHCTFSPPLIEPTPSISNGTVKCHVNATYGTLSWPLGQVEIDHPADLNRFRWFANFLLNGDVVPGLNRWTKCLLSRPETMVKSWAKLQPRTDILLRALAEKKVDNKDELLKTWSKDKFYLLEEFKAWVPLSAHNDLIANWPPIS